MKYRANDPRVQAVMHTLELLHQYEAEDERRMGTPIHGQDGPVDSFVYRGLMHLISFTGWPEQSMRDLVSLLLMNATDGELDACAKKARSEAEWVAEYTLECESPGGPWYEADREREQRTGAN